MAAKKSGYETIKILIEGDHIKQFDQIFDTVSRTNMAKDLGMNYQTFVYRLNRPIAFTLEQLIAIANLIGVERRVIVDLVIKQVDAKKKGKS
ncbi:hypothetical protein [Chitinophaga ginsengisoli]|uniref:Cro/C1-type helix-turn-helix DNA-binding protein n=1 Tax=Chitinophaga ginsengisoli TaxID=363837 RepID=A0A2P8GCW8_9BACT|nr:hypothetical protein [Chitinophaga ginsengisoli]PSL31725.1 hypothetical protein CLV42_10418 [Chitinophaga ginsengisoli]